MSRKMKDSGVKWVGKIPENWGVTRLKYAYDNSNGSAVRVGPFGSALPSSDYISDGEWIYNQRTVLDENFTTNNTCVSKEKANSLSGFRVYPGDILITTRGTLGRIAVVPNGAPSGILHPCIIRFRVDSNIVMPELLKYMFNDSDFFIKQIEFANNSTTIEALYSYNLRDLILPAIPITEQSKIVHFLNRKCTAIDTAIEKTKKSIEKLEEYKKAVITKAVTKGIDPNAKMKDSGVKWIGEIPEDWEVKRLKHAVTKLSKGNGITKDDVVENGDVSCVRYGEIYTQYNYVFDKCKTRTNMGNVSSPQTFSYGDILCAGTGELIDEIGKPVVYLGKELCLAGGDIIVIKHQQDPLFMIFLLNSAYCQGQRSIGKYKLKVVHISTGDIGNIKIALPRLNDQRKIAQFLKEKSELINGMIEAKINSIMKLEEYKKSLIYYAVTGKIDCRNEVI